MSEKTVFISYSHDTTAHSQRVLELANVLRSQGVDVELDQYHVRPPQGWPRWCEEQLRPDKAAFVLVICTDIYRQRVEGRTRADEGRGVFWEGGIIHSYLYNEKGNKRFIPVLLPGAKEEDIPLLLRDDTRYHPKAFDLNDAGYLSLYRELTGQPAVIKPPVGLVISLPPDGQSVVNPLNPLPARQVLSRFVAADISRIIKYAPAELIGREAETKLLSDAWDQAVHGEPKRLHVLTFVALGGEGKTSLVAKWAAELAHQDWPGCDAVFAWSFYSQGTREQTAGSSDVFLKEALTFFGDPAMAGGAQGAFDKGRRLARLVGERRALLILDGLEPLQYAPTSPTPGELKDQGLAALLKGLAANSHGLCV
ncbi:MAG: SEFIR domain-containing protein, partial [Gammaproteobacteria bacterium]